MTTFKDILRDYYSLYLKSWHRMILEHSSVHFLWFINHLVLKQSLNAEKRWNSNMHTWLEDRKCAVWTACCYFFTFHFCCNGFLLHSTLNHDGHICLLPWHAFWMERTLVTRDKASLRKVQCKWGAYLHGDHFSSTAEQICSEASWIQQSFQLFPLPPIYYTVILAAAWLRRSSEWRLLFLDQPAEKEKPIQHRWGYWLWQLLRNG